MTTATSTLSPEEQAAVALLGGSNPSNNPAPTPAPAPTDPRAGKNNPGPAKPAAAGDQNSKLLKSVTDLRGEFDALLRGLPGSDQVIKQEFEEAFQEDKPQSAHTQDELYDLKARLEAACRMLGRLGKIARQHASAAAASASAPAAQPATAPAQAGEGQKKYNPSKPEPPTTPTTGKWGWFTGYWKHWLAGSVAAITFVVMVILLMTGTVRFGGQGSGGGTPPKQPANVKFDL